MSRKIYAPIITLLLVIGVGFAIYISATEQFQAFNVEQVSGVSGSEKLPFFRDERTIEALSKSPHNLTPDVEKAGSRQIATSYNLKEYDFAFPAGIPAAEKIKQENHVNKSYQPFFTPMVVASWKPIAEILIANDVVTIRDGIYYIVNLEKLFDLIVQKKRWTDLEKSELYPANKSVLITTTDIRKSNSAAMYLALASYVFNGNAIVQSLDQAAPLIDKLGQLFLRQGFTESSSQAPFQNYLTMGPGKSPLVMIYEAQFLYEAAKPDGAIIDDMVLLYPEPTLFTKHILIPMTERGERLGEALSHDESLQRIATEHGLRTDNTKLFNQFVKDRQLQVPGFLVNVIEPPSYAVLEGMIQMIEQQYSGSTGISTIPMSKQGE
jgi:hypothetical protein